MPDHYYAQPTSRRRIRRIMRRFLPAVVVLGLIIILALIAIQLTEPKNDQPVNSGAQTSVQGSSRVVFRTPYFQFQASDAWREDAQVSKDGVYVYRAYRGPLIEQDLKIYVNSQPPETAVTRVLPVSITDEGLLKPQDSISKHCKTAVPSGQKNDIALSLASVRILCDPDGALYSVIVGESDGDASLKLKRPDDEPATYVVIYRDLTANPLGRDMRGIVSSFQTR